MINSSAYIISMRCTPSQLPYISARKDTYRHRDALRPAHANELAEDDLHLRWTPVLHVHERARTMLCARVRVQARRVPQRVLHHRRVKSGDAVARGEEHLPEIVDLLHRRADRGDAVLCDRRRRARDLVLRHAWRGRGCRGARLEVGRAEDGGEGEAREGGGDPEARVPEVLAIFDALDLGDDRGLAAACGEDALEVSNESGLFGRVRCC